VITALAVLAIVSVTAIGLFLAAARLGNGSDQ
jgi:hypothetical protein